MTASHNDVVRESFARQVGIFSGDDSPFAREFAGPVAWLGPVDEGMIALDVACGAAHLSEQAAPFVRQVIGVDLTAELLATGAERLAAAGLHNVLLQRGDACSLPFVDESFDIVMCRSSIHHFAEPDVALREMARVCRRDGRVVISDMVAPTAGVRDAFDDLHRRIDPSHVRALVSDELVALVDANVGPATLIDESAITLPVSVFLTDAGDRDGARAVLDGEVAGDTPTGFEPVFVDGDINVTFRGAVVHAAPRG